MSNDFIKKKPGVGSESRFNRGIERLMALENTTCRVREAALSYEENRDEDTLRRYALLLDGLFVLIPQSIMTEDKWNEINATLVSVKGGKYSSYPVFLELRKIEIELTQLQQDAGMILLIDKRVGGGTRIKRILRTGIGYEQGSTLEEDQEGDES